MTLGPAEWKRFYEAERERLGRHALSAMIERAPRVSFREDRAVIFPHTRAEVTGTLVAAAACAIIESGADEALAIGVLHGAPSPERRVHLVGDVTRDEFSLDAFHALLALAAEKAGRRVPRVHVRYPLHVGNDPRTLEGIEEIVALASRMPIVATADPLHHGIGYGDAKGEARTADDARASIVAQFKALSAHDFEAFSSECARVRSDFRNAGPVLAVALGRGFSFDVRDVVLVDYAEALTTPSPTWVAGALVTAR